MTLFRPCIDLHEGQVKQIVGGSLRDHGVGPQTNFVASEDSAAFATRYRHDDLRGGHVIMLGPGNDAAARRALAAWPGGLQIGGGITLASAPAWISAGAAAVIVTSWLFDGPQFQPARLAALGQAIGRERLVVDLSCRRTADGWVVCTNRWQTRTDLAITPATLAMLAGTCAELLIHAVDVEGLCRGMDEDLLTLLGQHCPVPCTYAGGASSLADLQKVKELSAGRVDLTIGSALDIFGGKGVRYGDCVAWNRAQG